MKMRGWGGKGKASEDNWKSKSEWGYSNKNDDSSRPRKSARLLLGNAGVFQEIDVAWQLLRLSCSVRSGLMRNRSNTKPFEPEFLVKNSEICLFRDPGMHAEYFA
jgi:hypothetical protein